MPKKLYTTAEAARFLKVDYWSLYMLHYRNLLKPPVFRDERGRAKWTNPDLARANALLKDKTRRRPRGRRG